MSRMLAPLRMPIRIIIVEDHLATQRVLAKMLLRRGYVVETAATGAEALRMAEGCKFDLLICDIALPDINGWNLLIETHKICPHIPGIAITGFGQLKDITRSEVSGFKMHLTKPVTIEEVDQAIENVLGRRPEPPLPRRIGPAR
jgi:CheY-like chemotaxis protein